MSVTDRPTPRLDRRQVLKAGAWAAPAVLVAATAPMAAATGGNVLITMNTFTQDGATVHWDGAQSANVLDALKGRAGFITVWNAPQAVTSARLTLTVTPSTNLATPPTATAAGAGWSFLSATVAPSGTSVTYVFLFTGSVAAGGSSPLLEYALAGAGKPYAAGISATGVLSSPQASNSETKTTTWN